MRTKSNFWASVTKESPFFFAVPALIWQLLFFYIPFICVFGLSITKSGAASWLHTFTLEHYAAFFHVTYARIFFRSFCVALGTTLLCVLFGYPVAYYMACKARRFRSLLLFMIIVPFWTNFVVQIYAWFFVLEKNGLLNRMLMGLGVIDHPLHILNSALAVYIGMLYCFLPFMIMPIYSSLEGFDARLLEASADLGASAWRTWLRVTLPLSASAIKTGCLLVFILTFGEFLIPELMSGGKELYVGSLIGHYFLVARSMHQGAALTGISCFILFCCSFFIHLFFKYCIMRTPRGK